MSLLTLYDETVSEELGTLLTELQPSIESYSHAKKTAQKERMVIIGKCAEYRRQFPQNSEDHKVLTAAMSAEGWSASLVSQMDVAYTEFRRLNGIGVEDFKQLAEEAAPSHLYEMGSSDDHTIAVDASRHLKREGKLPSQKAMRGYKAGFHNSNFEPRAVPSPKKELEQSTTVQPPKHATPPPFTVPYQEPEPSLPTPIESQHMTSQVINVTPVEEKVVRKGTDLINQVHEWLQTRRDWDEKDEQHCRTLIKMIESYAGNLVR